MGLKSDSESCPKSNINIIKLLGFDPLQIMYTLVYLVYTVVYNHFFHLYFHFHGPVLHYFGPVHRLLFDFEGMTQYKRKLSLYGSNSGSNKERESPVGLTSKRDHAKKENKRGSAYNPTQIIKDII